MKRCALLILIVCLWSMVGFSQSLQQIYQQVLAGKFRLAEQQIAIYLQQHPNSKRAQLIASALNPVRQGTVKVKGGTFLMGSDEGYYDDEQPTHQVKLSDFYISKYEVTNLAYWVFLKRYKPPVVLSDIASKITVGKSGLSRGWRLLAESEYGLVRNKDGSWRFWDTTYAFHPIAAVSYYGALAFCEYYDLQLPTEAQWEYAARGGQLSKGYQYAGSNELEKVGWYEENAGDLKNIRTHVVGLKLPNELGLYDMSGNVNEWCEDSYHKDYYAQCKKKGVVENPKGWKFATRWQSLRGGHLDAEPLHCTTTYRHRTSKQVINHLNGIRLVKSIK